MSDSPRVRKCKAIRDRIYDREQFGFSVFKREVLKLLSPESTIVDIGCGRKAKFLRSLSSNVKKAYGIDPDVRETIVDGNLQIMNGNAEAIPLPDHSVDVVTMVDVVEHLRDPERVFGECKRILKHGGSLISIAPCKLYPPTAVGRLIPFRLRRLANRIVTSTETEDTFPAYYKANSYLTLHRLSSSVGLSVVTISYLIYHPELFMFSTFVYRCAVAVERFVLQRDAFRCLRHQIFCHLMSLDEADTSNT
jgi:ubiquinone/menaquinone biosynthesis C-methylase UbiE